MCRVDIKCKNFGTFVVKYKENQKRIKDEEKINLSEVIAWGSMAKNLRVHSEDRLRRPDLQQQYWSIFVKKILTKHIYIDI